MLAATRDDESYNRNEDNENDDYLPIHHDFMAELTSNLGKELHDHGVRLSQRNGQAHIPGYAECRWATIPPRRDLCSSQASGEAPFFRGA